MAAFAPLLVFFAFMGFRQLVAARYPIIGYLGILMLVKQLLLATAKKLRFVRKRNSKSSLSIVEKAMIPIKTNDRDKRGRTISEKPQFLIMIFSMKTPMHMSVRKWGLVRMIRNFISQVLYFCYNY